MINLKPTIFLYSFCALINAPISASALDIESDFTVFGDLRLVTAGGEKSWLDKGLGKSRYGSDSDGSDHLGVHLSEISLLANVNIGWDWQIFTHASYSPEQHKPVDVIESFLKYRPAPMSALSWSGRAGLFFPHISRENVGVAWTSPYSITPSAINSWVGEEVRVGGLEATASYKFDSSKLSLTGSLFGYNDPSGTLLAFRGWALHDLKIGAFSSVPLAPIPSLAGVPATADTPARARALPQDQWTHPSLELDDKIGYYLSLDYDYGKKYKLGALWYDNRGDPSVRKGGQYAWGTSFWNIYADLNITDNFKLIAQAMKGTTLMGSLITDFRPLDVDYKSAFILGSYTMDKWRFSARAETFKTIDNTWLVRDDNDETGHSFMIATSHTFNKNGNIVAEWLYIDSKRDVRQEIGLPLQTKVNQFQLSYRYQF